MLKIEETPASIVIDVQEDDNTSNPQTTISIATLTYRQAFWEQLKYTVPYLGSSVIFTGSAFAVVAMIGKLGTESLAAHDLSSSLKVWFNSTEVHILSAISTVAARRVGEGNLADVGKVLHQGWACALVLSVPAMIVMLANKPIFLKLGQDPKVVELTNEFFYGYLFSLPPMLMLACNRKISLATGNAIIGAMFDLFYQGTYVGLSYYFIFGSPKRGFPALGYANTISAWLTWILSTGYMLSSERFKSYKFKKFRKEDFCSGLGELANIGLPSGVKVGVESLTGLVTNLWIGHFGPTVQAAQAVYSPYTLGFQMITLSIMDTTATLVSNAVGAKNIENAKKLGNSGIILGVSIASAGFVLYMARPKLLLSAFLDVDNPENQAIIHTACKFMTMMGMIQVADAFVNIATGALTGFYDVIKPTAILVSSQLLITLPLNYFLGSYLNWKGIGLIGARGIGIGVSNALIFPRFIYKTENELLKAKFSQRITPENVLTDQQSLTEGELLTVEPTEKKGLTEQSKLLKNIGQFKVKINKIPEENIQDVSEIEHKPSRCNMCVMF